MTMILVNGIEADRVAVGDRGLQYGDGLFETFAVRDGAPEYWDRHMQRLQKGAERLGIPMPEVELLAREAARICRGRTRAVLKLMLTRGEGGRGYRPPADAAPTRILSLHPWPDYPPTYCAEGIRLRLCRTPMGRNPALAGIKHLNRLEQVLARAEWDDPDIPEGLMLDTDGDVISGTMTNVFLVRRGGLYTPDLSHCGVEGTTRARLLELAARHGIPCEISALQLDSLWGADEVFVCNSVAGIWPVRRIEQHRYVPGTVTQRCITLLSQQDGS